MTTTTKFTITLGSDDHEVLDDAVKRVLTLEDDKTNLVVTPIATISGTDGSRRIQRRRVRITSDDDKILVRAERLDFQKGVSVIAKNGRKSHG